MSQATNQLFACANCKRAFPKRETCPFCGASIVWRAGHKRENGEWVVEYDKVLLPIEVGQHLNTAIAKHLEEMPG